MKFYFRYAGVLLMLLLIAFPASLQDESNDSTSDGVISVGGSGIAARVFEALANATETTDAFEVNVTGTDTGIANFCAGTLDIALTTRVLSQPEGSNCEASGVAFYETLLAYDAYGFAVQEGFSAIDCVSSVEETAIFAPSSGGTVVNWSDVAPSDAEDLALTLYLPAPNTTAYALLDAQLPGDGFRSDAQILGSYEDVIAAVAADEGGVGLVSLAAAQDAEGITLLPLASIVGTCFDASAENISDGVYPAATGLFAYVNATAMENEDVRALFDTLVAEESSETIAGAGFTAPVADDLGRVSTALAEGTTGRTFSRAVVAYQISPGVAGTVTTGGTAAAFAYVDGLTQLATQQYTSLVIDANFAGQAAGAETFCNGNLNVLYTSGGLTEEQAALCETNEVAYVEQSLGAQTVVLVSNANSDYLSCLTTDQLNTIWNVNAEGDLPESWNALGEGFPEGEMFLFAPNKGDVTTSVLLTSVANGPAIEREVTENRADPLYRAAAAANVEGALTYMSWRDYQRVLDNGQEGIQLVSVDAGNGCVEPSVSTVVDGSYALTRPVTMFVNREALAQEPVKAFVWYTFSDQNLSRLEAAGFVGLNQGDFADVRDSFQTVFEEVDAEAAAAAALQLETEPTTEGGEAEDTDTETEATPEGEETDDTGSDTGEDESGEGE